MVARLPTYSPAVAHCPRPRSLRRAASLATALFAAALLSCSVSPEDDPSPFPRLGRLSQALDSDGDSLDDAWETSYFGNLSQTGSGDFDADGMTNLEEYVNGFNPTVDDAFNDADHDRYPNVFEVRRGSNPNSSSSKPTPNYTVDVAGGGTHTTISAALGAADVANGNYQIIGISPGIYTGNANARAVTVASTKPKLLFIGLQGAAKTIIDGGLANYGWVLGNSAVVSSLTFRKTWIPLYVDASGKEVRFSDLLVRDNTAGGGGYAAGVHIYNAAKVRIAGSTFLNNQGAAGNEQLYFGSGASTLANTVVWGSSSGTMAAVQFGATLTSTSSLVKGLTLSGAGNLAGTTNPKLSADARPLWDSPLRAAGAALPDSWIDYDGESRPSTNPDIGVDQFFDSDGDGLADSFELARAGNLTTLTSRTQDADGDGLTNDQEYAALTNPVVADTDGDGLSDGAEVNTQGTNPLSTDTDGDDMPDGWEVSKGLSPLVANRFEDADGDRYPNVFEYFYGTDPSNRASVPTPTYVVNGAGGGTHTTISGAMNAATLANGPYVIVGIAPGTYSGAANLRDVTIPSTKPTLLFIGLQGAAKTIVDGGLTNYGWLIQSSAVISSLTFQKAVVAFYVDSPTAEVRFVDLMVRDNTGPSWAAGVHVNTAAKIHIASSTFLENTGKATLARDVWSGQGTTTMVNTLFWGSATGPRLGVDTSFSALATSYCLAKGQTLTGTGNLAGTTNAKLRSDYRPRASSPLRGAGIAGPSSRIDFDGELRPSSAPDIGVDHFLDTDSDGLPDSYEMAVAGNLTSIVGSADTDGDELSNAGEYDWETDRLDSDTDNDGVWDGVEVAIGKNPLLADADDLFGDLNQDGIIDSIGAQLGRQPDQLDSDGDSVTNANEILMCTNPLRSDTDGDGYPDNTDAFPLDPRLHALPLNPADTTAPIITLTAPWYAVPQ